MYVEAEISTGEDGTERLIDTLSLIDAVMPDVVTSRKQVDSSGKAPIKAEPGGSSMDSPSAPNAVEGGGVGGGGGGDPMDVDSAIEIPVEKSTVLKGHDSEVGGGGGWC
jgi:transducin (beta)-like 1